MRYLLLLIPLIISNPLFAKIINHPSPGMVSGGSIRFKVPEGTEVIEIFTPEFFVEVYNIKWINRPDSPSLKLMFPDMSQRPGMTFEEWVSNGREQPTGVEDPEKELIPFQAVTYAGFSGYKEGFRRRKDQSIWIHMFLNLDGKYLDVIILTPKALEPEAIEILESIRLKRKNSP